MKKVNVKVTVCDKEDEIFKGRGIYYADGRVRVQIEEYDGILEIDPNHYGKNPRRLMYQDENGDYRWSPYYLRSTRTQTVKLTLYCESA
jgi:hypothetical protein